MPRPRRPQRGPSGFTLIELIAAIGVVGVVSATAVPRLTALAGEARFASLQVAQGSLSSVAAIAHGQFAIRGSTPDSMQTYGDVALPMVNGYPGAAETLAAAAGLAPGYAVHVKDAGTLLIVPKDLAGSAAADQCYLVYTQSRTPQAAPVIALGATASAASCS